MGSREIDAYLADLQEPKRGTLERLRRTILEIIPEADEGLSYGVPAFSMHGTPVAGFAASKAHLSFFPHSGSVISRMPDVVAGYSTSKGTLRFAIDEPLPKELVEKLIEERLRQLRAESR